MGDMMQQDKGLNLKETISQEININSFPPEEQGKIRDIAAGVDIRDSHGVLVFGVSAQRDISEFSDKILSDVRAKDSGYVGEILTDLVMNVKGINVNGLSSGKGFLESIPIIGKFVNKIRRFIARYEKLSVKIEKITDELDKARMTLLKDITMLDNMYEKNMEYMHTLDLYAAAGAVRLKDLREKDIPEAQKKAESSDDPAMAQEYQDLVQAVNRFEKKVHDLKLSRMIAIQTGPQLRLIQNGNQQLVEKIQNSILTTIPLWKNQVVIAISLYRQQKAGQLQKEISDTTNELLEKNAELLKTNAAEIARESERGIVDIETLKKVNSDLIGTIEETLKIQKEGRAKRIAAEKELIKLESDLKAKLTSMQA